MAGLALNNVELANKEEGEAENIKYLEESLKMAQSLFPGNHPEVANLLNNVGMAYLKLGGEENILQSLKYFEESLKMYQALFPGNHPDVATLLNNVGTAYMELAEYENIKAVAQQEALTKILIPGLHPACTELEAAENKKYQEEILRQRKLFILTLIHGYCCLKLLLCPWLGKSTFERG